MGRQAVTLICCFLAGLGCGTMYIYSAYAPQLASRLALRATSVSFLGMVGNLGMAVTGPLSGSVVDRKGPRIPIVIAAIATSLGYWIIKKSYESSNGSVPVLAFALLIVGIGSTFGFSAVVKSAALAFPRARGFATSVPMAAFGLSAFFMSTLASEVMPGDTLGFLTMLSIVPCTLFMACLPFIRFPEGATTEAIEMKSVQTSRGHGHHGHVRSISSDSMTPDATESAASSLSSSGDIYGSALLRSRLFWSHFLVMGVLAGIGQMYIYSCGYCVRALLGGGTAQGDQLDGIDEAAVQTLQSVQVSIISLSSFAGRLLSGSLSDLLAYRYKLQRTWLLVGAGLVSLSAQFAGYSVNSVNHLWLISAETGLAYGICYGSYPTIVGDAFGMKYFSQNWGLLALSPLSVSYLFNMLFGYYYDINSVQDADGRQVCRQGRLCYSSAFKVTLCGAVFVIGLACHVIMTQRKHDRRA